MEMVIWIGLGLFVFALILFPEVRQKITVLVRGGLNVFVEDTAKTPEGAEAVFAQAIIEAEEQCSKASTTYNKLRGREIRLKDDIVRIDAEIKKVEDNCEIFAKKGDINNARIYADRRAELLSEKKMKMAAIENLTPMVADAKQIHEEYDKKLRNLKRKKTETVNQIKMNVQMKDLLGDLDDLRKDSATSKMLDAVMNGSNDLMEEVSGARAVHENKASTKIARAEQQATHAQIDEYLQGLLNKYNKN